MSRVDPPNPERQILHVDMDAFFAAAEQRDRPELRGRPVLVGGDPQGRGVVSTASYEARRFGCHSAMPMARAVRLCPEAVVVHPRMSLYAEIGRQILDIFERFTPLVEPLSIDEAFLDVSGCARLLGPAPEIARRVKLQIWTETQLTASVGVAPNKFLAKLASDLRKPDGLVVVSPAEIQDFLDPLPIARLWGVGQATLPRLESWGVHTFGDLRGRSLAELQARFGETGERFYHLVRGLDERPVVPDHQARSISHELTFPLDVDDAEHLRAVLLEQTEQVARRLRRQTLLARTVVLKIRLADFTTLTRRTTLATATDQTTLIWEATEKLFAQWLVKRSSPVRLIGMGVTQLCDPQGRQLDLFTAESSERSRRLDGVMDDICQRFGSSAVRRGLGPPDPPR